MKKVREVKQLAQAHNNWEEAGPGWVPDQPDNAVQHMINDCASRPPCPGNPTHSLELCDRVVSSHQQSQSQQNKHFPGAGSQGISRISKIYYVIYRNINENG